MTADRNKARELFLHAVGKLQPDGWDAYVAHASGGDAELVREVVDMLRVHREAGSFLGRPALGATGVFAPEGPAEAEQPGTSVGPYKLIESIGAGGMGAVWLAEQQEPVKRRVALKVIKAGMDSRQVLARFEVERQALALMDHPNIARVLDAGATPSGRPYFVMELVKGTPITTYCDDHRLTPRRRLELFVQVCHAVQHAHQKGVIHRDLKPSNVLVAPYDGEPVVKVIDFGVAKAAVEPLTERTLVTGLGAVIGTPEYMSPEQAELNNRDVDTRSDVYSLGVLLYELLTGTTPLTSRRAKESSLLEVLRLVREEDPPRPSSRLSTTEGLPGIASNRGLDPRRLGGLVRGELDWIVMKCLEKDRGRRYQTASTLASDVQRYLADEPVEALPPSTIYRLRKLLRRNRGLALAAGLALFSLVLLGSGVGWAVRDRTAQAAEEARRQGERHAKVAGRVDSLLAEADRLEREQNWPEALAAARQAEAAVSGGEADPATEGQVRQRLTDLAFINRLEQIRMDRATANQERAGQEYARAFRDYGVAVDELPAEASIEHLKARPGLATPLAAALDHWVSTQDPRSGGWKTLVAVARGIDPDPLRDRLRSTWGHPIAPDARDELRRLADSIDVRAHHPEALVSMARVLRRANHPDAAVRMLQDARSVYPDDYWINTELGTLLYQQRDPQGAVRFHTAAVSIRPSSAGAHYDLGVALRSQKKLAEAVACLRKAVELDPNRVNFHIALGYALGLHGKTDEATAAYESALRLRPDNVFTHHAYGCFLRDIKHDYEGAITHLNKAIELDSKYAANDDVHVYADLVSALGMKALVLANSPDPKARNPRRAIEVAQKAVEVGRGSTLAWQYMGWVQYRVGDWRASIEALEKSCELRKGGKGNVGQWIVLALAHDRLAAQEDVPEKERAGHRSEARRRYEEANRQIDQLWRDRPDDLLGQVIWDFRAEARELLGTNDGKK